MYEVHIFIIVREVLNGRLCVGSVGAAAVSVNSYRVEKNLLRVCILALKIPE